MIIGVSDSTKYLYHYTKAQTAIDFILKGKSLKFAPYTLTNDPKERKGWLFNFGSNEGRDLAPYRQREQSAWLSDALKGKTKVACFTQDEQGLTGNHLNDISLRGFCKPRMWAHYGDNGAGVCLVFLREHIERAIAVQFSRHLILSGAVKYVNRSVVFDFEEQQFMINVDELENDGREVYFQRHLRAHYPRMFLEKMADWRGENEWRWVIFSDTVEPLYLDISNALAGVIFGDETSDEHRAQIRRLNRGTGAEHMRLSWKNCSPWYDFPEMCDAQLAFLPMQLELEV